MTTVDEGAVRSGDAALDSQHPPLRPELQDALRRQIEHAITPVLADFQEQSMRTVRQEIEQARSAEYERERPEAAAQSEGTAPSGSVLDVLEQAGEQWVRSRIDDGRDAVCSEHARTEVRHSIERTFEPLLEAGVGLVPDASMRRALRQESEQALDELIGNALDRFCAGQVVAELQRHAESAIRALVRLDLATLLREAWEAIRALCRAIVAAVQDEWQRLLHHLLGFLLKAAQEMVGTLLKEGLASIVAVPVEEIEEKTETAKESVEEKVTELRERLAERLGELRDRIKEEVGKVKERVAEGLQSAAQGGTRDETFGRPPTGRPPNGRPPSTRAPDGRPPTGRPPSGRPPSGLPPSMTRRRAS
jgi:hypothetical protein